VNSIASLTPKRIIHTTVMQFARPGLSHGRNGIRGKNNSSAFKEIASRSQMVFIENRFLSSCDCIKHITFFGIDSNQDMVGDTDNLAGSLTYMALTYAELMRTGGATNRNRPVLDFNFHYSNFPLNIKYPVLIHRIFCNDPVILENQHCLGRKRPDCWNREKNSN